MSQNHISHKEKSHLFLLETLSSHGSIRTAKRLTSNKQQNQEDHRSITTSLYEAIASENESWQLEDQSIANSFNSIFFKDQKHCQQINVIRLSGQQFNLSNGQQSHERVYRNNIQLNDRSINENMRRIKNNIMEKPLSSVVGSENSQNNRHFDATDMELSSLPDTILQMKCNLCELNLSYNKLEIFPSELCQFVQLKKLLLDFNQLRSLPDSIAFLKQLEELSVSHNLLEQLPKSLQNITHLRTLNVGANCISNIGMELTNLKHLEVLYIYNNTFTTIPAKLRNLTQLREFALDWFRYTNPPLEPLIQRYSSAPYNKHKDNDKVKDKDNEVTKCSSKNSTLVLVSEIIPSKKNSAEPPINGETLFGSLFALCAQHENSQISFFEFINHFSQFSTTDQLDTRGWNIAFKAVENEDLGVISALVNNNRNILNQLNVEGNSLLVHALLGNKYRSIRLLVSLGADPTKGGGLMGSALYIAASKLDSQLVQTFLKLGSNPNQTDFEGNTPLHMVFSIFHQNISAAKIIANSLLAHQADPNLLNTDLWTPLHLAVKKNQKEALRYAIEYNLSHRKSKPKKINVTTEDPDNISNSQGYEFNNQKDDSDYSNNSDEQIDQNSLNGEESTIVAQKPSCAQVLLPVEQDQNIDKKSTENQTTSIIQIKNSQIIPQILFKFNKQGGLNLWTPVHLASNIGNIQILELLSEANACPFSLTKFAQTPRKTLKKQEDRWIRKNILDESLSLERTPQSKSDRKIQNLRGLIAESMKQKEHFLREQLDFFDDKEFGYSIKKNMINTQLQNPHNEKEAEEDEIMDPEKSFADFSFKFIKPSPIICGLKPFEYGSVQSKQENETERRCKDVDECQFDEEQNFDEDSLMDNLDEHDQSPIDRCNSIRFRKDSEVRSQFEIKQTLSEANKVDSVEQRLFQKSIQKQNNPSQLENKVEIVQEDDKMTNEYFGDIIGFDHESFSEEIRRITSHFMNPNTEFSECLSVLNLLKMIHIRLSYQNNQVTLVSQKGTLPRNIHLMNEFLLSKMGDDCAFEEKEYLPKLFVNLVKQILPLIQNVNGQSCYSLIDWKKQAVKQGMNVRFAMLLLNIQEILLNLNCFDSLKEIEQAYNELFADKNEYTLAFSNCEYSPHAYFIFNQLQNMFVAQIFKNNIYQIKNMYRAVGSPESYYEYVQLSKTNAIKQQQKKMKMSTQSHISSNNLINCDENTQKQSQNKEFIQLSQYMQEPNLPEELSNNYRLDFHILGDIENSFSTQNIPKNPQSQYNEPCLPLQFIYKPEKNNTLTSSNEFIQTNQTADCTSSQKVYQLNIGEENISDEDEFDDHVRKRVYSLHKEYITFKIPRKQTNHK